MSKTANPVLDKSYAFALRVIKCYTYLNNTHKCYDLARQLLRSGTSIGANIEEAQGGQSKRDFIAKLQISYKEARETHYWLRLLRDADFLNEQLASSMIKDCKELLFLLTAILNSSKKE